MAWTTPQTFTAGQVVAASDLNTSIRDNTNYLYGDTAWQNVTTYTNSWAAASGTTPRYRLIGSTVHMQGQISGGTVGISTPAFTLPAGYRPTQAINLATADAGSAPSVAQVLVSTNGQVAVLTDTNTAWIGIYGSWCVL